MKPIQSDVTVMPADVGLLDVSRVTESPNQADAVVTISATPGQLGVMGSVDVAPALPLPQALNGSLSAEATKQLEAALGALFERSELIEPIVKDLSQAAGLLVAKETGRLSPDAADLELQALLATIITDKSKIDRERILQARSENIERIQQNQDKMAESLNAAKEAKKSGLAAKIFGWIGAIASVIVGIVMCATGVGAAAGALMIAGGVVGIVSNALQQAAQDGLISKKAMEALGPVMMAVEILVAVASLVVTLGASAAGAVAKVASKVATEVGGTVGELAASLSQKATKAANLATKAFDVAGKSVSTGVKVATSAPKLVADVGGGASKLAASVMDYKLASTEADTAQARAELDAGEALVRRLVEAYAPSNKALEDALDSMLGMLRDNAETQERVFNRMNNVPGGV
ncbi:type III secretion system translocon subunit SctE [Pseudomonas plecoglossicida]|uniref:Translocator protein BipB-like C-terminal domain-containing protein n=1 Tax=Pseudomonas plecoglossicida TaxID=70775 RepID=A0AAD0VSM0_PSEDL|nr:type III secretion system translocon subunit SctE [Pseudomonas plecoglossicida]AXM95533.1 hypothetical protein DVB73_06825 [Pseudomonas plecoglossicida]EPB94338.1 translocator protein [Pseudomonas plecoglossicida NB2011]QLB56280.1 type III secretion system translocon subunit SctE [Pseudomonas plecoglossicida]GLR37891.1 translocator protein PopB [Pseudomonas plecoglossicida]